MHPDTREQTYDVYVSSFPGDTMDRVASDFAATSPQEAIDKTWGAPDPEESFVVIDRLTDEALTYVVMMPEPTAQLVKVELGEAV